MTVANPRPLLAVSGVASLARALLVVLLAGSAVVTVALLPYWGRVRNLWGV